MKDIIKKVLFFLVVIDMVIAACLIRKSVEESYMEQANAAISADAFTEEQLQEQKPKIALTFDDGPDPVYTEQVLDVLKEKKVRATFFVLGKCVDGNESVVKRIVSEGHLIGNHTFDHVNLTELDVFEACEQLTKTGDLVEHLTGQKLEFVRPPFGAWNCEAECATDLIPVLWSIDTLDWCYQNTDKSFAKVEGKVKENDIILMHDQYAETVELLKRVIDYLQEQGYELVTVDEIIMN